jgi:glycosyltransferase involved in cell wall biosynthesis
MNRMVSVITAARTGPRRETLRATIASVDAQTYRPLEHWIIFDGPSGLRRSEPPPGADPGRGVERHVLELGRRWHPITHGSWGLEALAVGLYLCRGTWACFVADDDAIAPDHVEHLVAAIRSDGGYEYALCAVGYANGTVVGDGTITEFRVGDSMILFRVDDYSRAPHRVGGLTMDYEWLSRFTAGKRGIFTGRPTYLARPHDPAYPFPTEV